uniref:Uncharacterized protein n=1 Tax=Arundo donax TaxID=35708 RepID=A0A0A9TSW0_ARUDO
MWPSRALPSSPIRDPAANP